MSPGTKVPIKPGAILGILKELRTAAKSDRPLAVTGARELVAVLTRELTRGGVASAVQEGKVEGAAALVHILAGAPDDDDERVLKEAAHARIPIVVVVAR